MTYRFGAILLGVIVVLAGLVGAEACELFVSRVSAQGPLANAGAAAATRAQVDARHCWAVLEWRYEGRGESWGSQPDICVPAPGPGGRVNIPPRDRGVHYRVKEGDVVALFTTDADLQDAGGCRTLARDGALQGHGTLGIWLGDWYFAYIMPGWHVSTFAYGCQANRIPVCDPGICGEWH